MKVQYVSDLHLEFRGNLNYIHDFKIKPVGDVLILAGDILYLTDFFEKTTFFQYCSDNWKLTLFVPGNHEYYDNYMIDKFGTTANVQILDNVYLLNNHVFKFEDVNFILSTLWSKIEYKDYHIIQNGISDFYHIRTKSNKLYKTQTVDNMNMLHDTSMGFLKIFLDNVTPGEKTVIATHFLPSTLCNAPEFNNTSLNPYFCVDLTNFILDNTDKINYWIYAHSHRNIDVEIGNTKLVSNQLGYFSHGEHKNFLHDKFFEI